MAKQVVWMVAMALLAGSAMAELPADVKGILDQYRQGQDKLSKYIFNCETTYRGRTFDDTEWATWWVTEEVGTDGQRLAIRLKIWGHNAGSKREPIPKESPAHNIFLQDNKFLYQYNGNVSKPGLLMLDPKKDPDHDQDLLARTSTSSPLQGVLHNELSQRVDKIIEQARKASVRPGREIVGKSNCFVIDAVTPNGQYTLWFDPDRGYNIAKAQIRRRTGDLEMGSVLGPGITVDFAMDNVRLEKIDGAWVPMGGDWEIHVKNSIKGTFWDSRIHNVRTKVQLNPDFDALRFFLPKDIPNKSRAILKDAPNGPKLWWMDGKVVPMGEEVATSGKAASTRPTTAPSPAAAK